MRIPVGPGPTSIRASRAPDASVTMTLFEPMPVMYARSPEGVQTIPRGSPTDSLRCATGIDEVVYVRCGLRSAIVDVSGAPGLNDARLTRMNLPRMMDSKRI